MERICIYVEPENEVEKLERAVSSRYDMIQECEEDVREDKFVQWNVQFPSSSWRTTIANKNLATSTSRCGRLEYGVEYVYTRQTTLHLAKNAWNALCSITTLPTARSLLRPSFCFSSSLRRRLTSLA